MTAFTLAQCSRASWPWLKRLQAKILVVDDDELELALLADRLESCGLMVHRASNGAEALQLLERIHAAFSTVKLRKSLQEANSKLQGLSS